MHAAPAMPSRRSINLDKSIGAEMNARLKSDTSTLGEPSGSAGLPNGFSDSKGDRGSPKAADAVGPSRIETGKLDTAAKPRMRVHGRGKGVCSLH